MRIRGVLSATVVFVLAACGGGGGGGGNPGGTGTCNQPYGPVTECDTQPMFDSCPLGPCGNGVRCDGYQQACWTVTDTATLCKTGNTGSYCVVNQQSNGSPLYSVVTCTSGSGTVQSCASGCDTNGPSGAAECTM